MHDLRNIDELRRACADALKTARSDRNFERWDQDLRGFLTEIREADLRVRETEEFQRKIWDDNPVADPGQGNIVVDAAITDRGFRRWLAEESMKPLPEASDARTEALTTLYEAIQERMSSYTDREAVQASDDNDVIGAQLGEQALELGPLLADTGGFLLEQLFAAGRIEASRWMERSWSVVDTRAYPSFMRPDP